MINFVLVSPLRVVPSDWARLSKYLSKSLKGSQKPPELSGDWAFVEGRDYKYHPLEAQDFSHGEPFAATLLESLTSALSRVRKLKFAARQIEENSVLLVFSTGEACVIELHEVDAGQAPTAIPTIREESSLQVKKAANLLKGLTKASKIRFELGETITHTVLLAEHENPAFDTVAKLCFKAEGLEYSSSGQIDTVHFIPGWSYSVCISSQPQRLWDRVALMTRAQCEWYDVRTAQEFCLNRLAETDENQSVSELVDLERRIVRYQTEFRLWRHRMQEYRANLKPELKECADIVERKWQTAPSKNYVHETLAQARDLIQTSYSRRVLIQERRQSLMIFVLTALGIMSIASIAATYWDWLRLAKLTEDGTVASQMGQAAVATMLVGLFLIMCVLVLRFILIRRKPE